MVSVYVLVEAVLRLPGHLVQSLSFIAYVRDISRMQSDRLTGLKETCASPILITLIMKTAYTTLNIPVPTSPGTRHLVAETQTQ